MEKDNNNELYNCSLIINYKMDPIPIVIRVGPAVIGLNC